MHPIDYTIIIVYLLVMVLIGVWLQKKASSGIDSYFLGSRSIPWWVLGASGMSSNLDVTGTMINTALLFALGFSGFFVEMRGGLTLALAFLMIFMGKWNRRARVMTMAEWMQLRFGSGRGGNVARIFCAISSIILTIAMITYFCKGAGKFVAEFMGIPSFLGLPPDFWAALMMIVLAMIYTVASGLYGVVWTDVFQSLFIFFTIISICFICLTKYELPEKFNLSVAVNEAKLEEANEQPGLEKIGVGSKVNSQGKPTKDGKYTIARIKGNYWFAPDNKIEESLEKGDLKELRALFAGHSRPLSSDAKLQKQESEWLITDAKYLFSTNGEQKLGQGKIPDAMRKQFAQKGIALSENSVVAKQQDRWIIRDSSEKRCCEYLLAKDGEKLGVYDLANEQGYFIAKDKDRLKVYKGKKYLVWKTTRQDWTKMLPKSRFHFPSLADYSMYNYMLVLLMFYLIKVILEGYGGLGGYMAQRYFAAKNDREAGLLSMFWTLLLSFRWPFIAAIVIMGISMSGENGIIGDPERVLPTVINTLVPVGLKGLLVAGLIAAAMSTFDSTVNGGAAYWVKDIYQAYLVPKASEKQLVWQSRIASIAIVVLALAFSLAIKNINEIWAWITMGIGAGMFIPQVIRWYWWRLNGWGFAVGTIIGMVVAIAQKAILPAGTPEYVAFSIIIVSSIIGTVVVTLATAPTDKAVLTEFYRRTRPFGLWKPITSELPQEAAVAINAENKRDFFATFLALPWQMVLFLTWMMVIMKRWDQFGYMFAALIVLSTGLYFLWYRHLGEEVKLPAPDAKD